MLFSEVITLEESISLAKENNKEINSERNALNSSEWSQKNALTNFLPKISFNSTMIRIDNKIYDTATEIMSIPVMDSTGAVIGTMPFSMSAMGTGFYKTSFQKNLTIKQPVFNGGKVILGYQLSKLAKEQAIYSVQNKENDITYQVASTYFNILKIQDLMKMMEKSLGSSKSHLQKVQDNYEVGTAKKSDVLQWQVKLQNDETALNEVKNNLKILLTLWKNLLGTDERNINPSEINVTNYDAEIKKYSTMDDEQIENVIIKLLEKTKQNNPILRSLSTTDKMMKKQLKMAKGNFLPSLNLQFTYEIENDDTPNFSGDDNWNFVVAFSLPIFSGGANYTNLEKTKYDVRKTNLMLESTKENILIGAKNAYYNLVTKAQTVENNKSSLKFAKENHKLINNLFEQGMITNSELLDADIMLFASEMNLVSAYYDYLIATYEIKKFINE
jgi:outer membrane protein TolC